MSKENFDIIAGVLFAIVSLFSAINISKVVEKKILTAIIAFLTAIGISVGSFIAENDVVDILQGEFVAQAPSITRNNEEEGVTMAEGDFYVSTKGDDNNDGTKDAPFLTIERAVEAVRETDKTGKSSITVCIEAGEYRVSSLKLTEEDSGTEDCPVIYCGYGDGDVVLNGGITLSPGDFKPASEYPQISERLSSDALNNVIVADLTKAPYSLGAEDWGKIYAIGSYHTAKSYDGDWTGPLYCELFVNDKRQTVARYPDSDFLITGEVVSTGLGKESNGSLTEVENWAEIRNPEPDVYRVTPELAERISDWKNLDDVWMMGYWKYDWADASSPIGRFDKESRELSPRFVSLYGTKDDAPYYFFNVLEELTTAGEWYLDRENGLLCMWKPDDINNAQIDLSLSLDPIIDSKASYVTFDGITIKGTRQDGMLIEGNNNTVQNCLIKNVAGNALVMTGSNNLAYNNEITHTGRGGIIITGGDTETLTPGNSKADNNYIHHWSEIYLTYQPAVTLNGVGNICSHNEISNAPHEAITYAGNNHIIEYNDIYEVCLLSDDAGAIYAGRSWIWYGNVIRYNCIYNIGSENHSPDGIYLDDALSGQKVYGNILVNIPRNSIHIGGGRDNLISNNIIINAGDSAVYFDERARDGALNNGWFTHAYIGTGDMWTALYESPWQSEIWQNAFPEYKNMTDDISKSNSPSYIPNPSSTVTNNLILEKFARIGDISMNSYRFGDVSKNAVCFLWDINKIFTDAENGDYTVKNLEEIRRRAPGFENIPIEKIGRGN